MRCEWPLAYENVCLDDHLKRTANLALCLFRSDVRVLANRVGADETTLMKMLALSSAMHDIGKASRYYLDMWKGREGLSFRYHEAVSALILTHASHHYLAQSRGGVACVFRTAAKTVSRHHVAMKGRHPKEHVNVAKKIKEIVDRLDEKDIARVLGQLSTISIISSELQQLESDVGDIIVGLKKLKTNSIAVMLKQLVQLSTNPGDICGNMNELMIVRAYAGFLIIADNLVASGEGREAEASPRTYVTSWERELKPKIEMCVPIVFQL